GGLVRSAGGWSAVKQLRRENAVAKGDERILGDGDFVEAVLAHATETLNRKHHLRNKDLDLETIIRRIGDLLGMTREEVLAAGKNRRTVHARSLLCYWAVEALGISMTGLSTRLDISVNAVSKSVARGRTLAKTHDLSMI
ncbi:MAG: transposase, partial [Desulfatirhabdiaceae bacterium]